MFREKLYEYFAFMKNYLLQEHKDMHRRERKNRRILQVGRGREEGSGKREREGEREGRERRNNCCCLVLDPADQFSFGVSVCRARGSYQLRGWKKTTRLRKATISC